MKKAYLIFNTLSLKNLYCLLFSLTLILNSQITYGQNKHFDHSIFDNLLKKYVDENGKVDYKNFQEDRKLLRQYLNSLGNNAPDTLEWSKEEQLAYWINLYNAFTTELILDHYPLESIRDIGTKIPIVFGESAWDIEFIHIGNKTYTLDAIEHQVLKLKFKEPRVHFALVCAAKSCPNLRREAYLPENLESQLSSQAVLFLSNPEKNKIGSNAITVSQVFKWYADEFTVNSTLIEYLNQYTSLTIDPKASVDYFEFDWALNGSE